MQNTPPPNYCSGIYSTHFSNIEQGMRSNTCKLTRVEGLTAVRNQACGTFLLLDSHICVGALWWLSPLQGSPQKKVSGGCKNSINLHNNRIPRKQHYCDLPVLKIVYLRSESLDV